MKIEQTIFEELIEQVINGKITRKEISKKYKISERKINAEITKLSETNPDLYRRFIVKFPFRPKTITNINYINLIKRIIKENIYIEDVEKQYEISRRTLSRRVSELKDSEEVELQSGLKNRELYELYKRYQRDRLSDEDREIISKFTYDVIRKKEIYEDREQTLRQLIDEYNLYISQGFSKAESARRLGYTYSDMYKKEEELKRIQKEKESKKTFLERIKCTGDTKVDISKETNKTTIVNIEEKGRE